MTERKHNGPLQGRRRAPGTTRIRRKLILLHTLFSIGMCFAILLVLRPPIRQLVAESEAGEARLALNLLASGEIDRETLRDNGIEISEGDAGALKLSEWTAERARDAGNAIAADARQGTPRAVVWDEQAGAFIEASVTAARVRPTAVRLYVLLIVAMGAIYGAVAFTLEFFVLPKQVYQPIERLRRADAAVQEGDRENEKIPEHEIPHDELGEIMRSRNRSIEKLRQQEQDLNHALARIEEIAGDLKRKNHLLETARRNLADQDRLASLGMMSAGIAHELNTPLTVLKGSLEQVGNEGGEGRIDPERLALMQRVVARLERLGEGLLDFARVRPPSRERVGLRHVVDEAWTLVSLDRDARGIDFENRIDAHTQCMGDADRLTQVFVNLLRNAVQAMEGSGTLRVTAETRERDGQEWVSVTVTDSGPGIEPEMVPRLFEPFASTRLDASGTGLGLAVAEGIVREHGGLLLARNAPGAEDGAEFEVMLPVQYVEPAVPPRQMDIDADETRPDDGGPQERSERGA